MNRELKFLGEEFAILRGFLGASGILVNDIFSDAEAIQIANKLFDLDIQDDLVALQQAIDALGRRERVSRIKANVRFISPTRLTKRRPPWATWEEWQEVHNWHGKGTDYYIPTVGQ